MLDMMVLLDSSGARRGLYDDLLMLLRKHSKKGFDVTKAMGCKSFLREMRKRVPTPVPRITKVQGQEVVHFSFLEMLHNLLSSTKFQDIDNLCANRDGFGFLLDEDLDEHQLDLFMIASWAILCNIRGKPHQYPNSLTLEVLSQHDETQEIFASIANEDGGTATVPSYLEASCKTRLRRSLLSRDIDFTANNAEDTVKY
jgi:hypothetical protein